MGEALRNIAENGIQVNVKVEPATVLLFGAAVFAAVTVANIVTRR